MNANTDKEDVFISSSRNTAFQAHSTRRGGQKGWSHLVDISRAEAIDKRAQFDPCAYYDQLNKGMLASHTIFNYANFLIFTRSKKIEARKLLVLDEGHQIENQIAEDIGISISNKTLQKYIATDLLENTKYSYDDDIETKWLELLDRLYSELDETIPNTGSKEIKIDVNRYVQRLRDTIIAIRTDPKNWIVSEIIYDAAISTQTKK